MSEHETEPTTDQSRYAVVLLVEQALSDADARQVRSLHEAIEDPVTYHVILPSDDAAARVEASLGAMGAGQTLGSPAIGAPGLGLSPEDLDIVQKEAQSAAERALDATLTALRSAGATAQGQIVPGDPVDALTSTVREVDGREAIVLTAPHVVAEFFHVDWTSQARRALGVPVLHLLEHENFDEQAGSGEGVNGV